MPLFILVISGIAAYAANSNATGNALAYTTLQNIVNLSHGIWNFAGPAVAIVLIVCVVLLIINQGELGLVASGCGCQIIALVIFAAVGAWVAGFFGNIALSAFSPEQGIVDNTKFILGAIVYVLLCWS